MKLMKELLGLSAVELQNRLREFKKELMKFKIDVSAGTGSASSGKVKRTKKNIARILTILKQKGWQQQ